MTKGFTQGYASLHLPLFDRTASRHKKALCAAHLPPRLNASPRSTYSKRMLFRILASPIHTDQTAPHAPSLISTVDAHDLPGLQAAFRSVGALGESSPPHSLLPGKSRARRDATCCLFALSHENSTRLLVPIARAGMSLLLVQPPPPLLRPPLRYAPRVLQWGRVLRISPPAQAMHLRVCFASLQLVNCAPCLLLPLLPR